MPWAWPPPAHRRDYRNEAAITALEAELAAVFATHAQAPIITSFPGLWPVLGARVLGELGDDPQRFTDARAVRSFAGTAPITRASGRSRAVFARRVCNRRLGDACHWWAFAALTKSDGARAHYDQRRALGDTHNAALRNLANKLCSPNSGTAYAPTRPMTKPAPGELRTRSPKPSLLTTDPREVSMW
jgi:transposase